MNEFNIIERSDESLPYDLLLLADPSKEMISQYIDSSTIFLAQLQKEIVGVLVLKRANSEAEIMNVAVDEKHQGKGIGSSLIQHAIHFAKKNSVSSLFIGTADTSIDQLKLYQKLGFQISTRIKNFFIDYYGELIFENGKQARDMIRLKMSLT